MLARGDDVNLGFDGWAGFGHEITEKGNSDGESGMNQDWRYLREQCTWGTVGHRPGQKTWKGPSLEMTLRRPLSESPVCQAAENTDASLGEWCLFGSLYSCLILPKAQGQVLGGSGGGHYGLQAMPWMVSGSKPLHPSQWLGKPAWLEIRLLLNKVRL